VGKSAQPAIAELEAMTTAQFEKWKPTSITDYARQHTIGGRWAAAEALGKSREEFETLLPKGMATPGYCFFSIVRLPDRKAVGMLWIQIQSKPQPSAFIFNIEIFKPFRRRGYATQAMKLLEQEARRLGLEDIPLHVFARRIRCRRDSVVISEQNDLASRGQYLSIDEPCHLPLPVCSSLGYQSFICIPVLESCLAKPRSVTPAFLSRQASHVRRRTSSTSTPVGRCSTSENSMFVGAARSQHDATNAI
jgi:RimJ/RimL family protein N-acetyltransferase